MEEEAAKNGIEKEINIGDKNRVDLDTKVIDHDTEGENIIEDVGERGIANHVREETNQNVGKEYNVNRSEESDVDTHGVSQDIQNNATVREESGTNISASSIAMVKDMDKCILEEMDRDTLEEMNMNAMGKIVKNTLEEINKNAIGDMDKKTVEEMENITVKELNKNTKEDLDNCMKAEMDEDIMEGRDINIMGEMDGDVTGNITEEEMDGDVIGNITEEEMDGGVTGNIKEEEMDKDVPENIKEKEMFEDVPGNIKEQKVDEDDTEELVEGIMERVETEETSAETEDEETSAEAEDEETSAEAEDESGDKMLAKEKDVYCDKENSNQDTDIFSCTGKERITEELEIGKAMVDSTTAYKVKMEHDSEGESMIVVENTNVSNSEEESIVEEGSKNNESEHESMDAVGNIYEDDEEENSTTPENMDQELEWDGDSIEKGACIDDKEKSLDKVTEKEVDSKGGAQENEAETRKDINTENPILATEDERNDPENATFGEATNHSSGMTSAVDKLLSIDSLDEDLKRLPFLRDMCKGKLTRLTKNHLEELALQKVAEVMVDHLKLAEIKKRIEALEKSVKLNIWKANLMNIQKFELMAKVDEHLRNLDEGGTEPPAKVVRSVGLQVGCNDTSDVDEEMNMPNQEKKLKRRHRSSQKVNYANKTQLDVETANSSIFKIPSKPSTPFRKIQILENTGDLPNPSHLISTPSTSHSTESALTLSNPEPSKLPGSLNVTSPQAATARTLALSTSCHQAGSSGTTDATSAPIHSLVTRVEVKKESGLATNPNSAGEITSKSGNHNILSSVLGHFASKIQIGLPMNVDKAATGAVHNVTILPRAQSGLVRQKAAVRRMPTVCSPATTQKGALGTWSHMQSRPAEKQIGTSVKVIDLTLEDDKNKSHETSDVSLVGSIKTPNVNFRNRGSPQILQPNQVLDGKIGVIRPQMGKRALAARPNEMTTMVLQDGKIYPVSQTGGVTNLAARHRPWGTNPSITPSLLSPDNATKHEIGVHQNPTGVISTRQNFRMPNKGMHPQFSYSSSNVQQRFTLSTTPMPLRLGVPSTNVSPQTDVNMALSSGIHPKSGVQNSNGRQKLGVANTSGSEMTSTSQVQKTNAAGQKGVKPTQNVQPMASSIAICKPTANVAHPAPLPETPLYTTKNKKLPPPAPVLKVTKLSGTDQEGGIVMSWDMNLTSEHEELASYQLFSYLEDAAIVPNSDLWKKIGDVKALPLPMACTLTQFVGSTRYHFAIRAVDMTRRLGPFSTPQFIEITL